jgi:hypothetical protein
MSRIISFVAVCGLLLAMAACGGGNSTPQTFNTPTPTPTPAALTVSPSSAQVTLGTLKQFTATGTGTPVNWQVNGVNGGNATVGTIDNTGLYHAPTNFPSPNQFNITAVSQADATKTASAPTTVVYPNNNANGQVGAVKLGTSGGNVLDESATACCIGTLGSLMSRGGTFFLLSNNHVLGRSDASPAVSASDVIDQPGPSACFGIVTNVGTTTTRAALKPTTGTTGPAPSNVDAAIAQVSPGTVDTSGTILDLGAAGPTSIADAPPSATVATPTIGMGVAKSGRTTGLTCSTIGSVSTTVSVQYEASCGGALAFTATFSNQVIVNGGTFSAGGDSGSLIVTSDTARPVALLYAGNSTSTAGNTIQDVIAAFTLPGPPVVTPTIVGGADHAVSCLPTSSAGTQVSAGQSTQISTRQQQAAINARDRNARVLMSMDPAIRSVDVGASADSPGEGALVIEVSAVPKTRIPAVVDGVRTKVVFTQGAAAPALSVQDIDGTAAIKDAHAAGLMAQAGIQGVGVGRSDDNPGETAIVIYTIEGVDHSPIPATMDGVRTKIVEGDRFRAFGWNAQLEPKATGCAKPKAASTAKK